jgi:hypothetical protein
MDNQLKKPESEGQLTLTDDAISVEKVASDETRQFQSTQVSKVTNEETGQNQQNFQNN